MKKLILILFFVSFTSLAFSEEWNNYHNFLTKESYKKEQLKCHSYFIAGMLICGIMLVNNPVQNGRRDTGMLAYTYTGFSALGLVCFTFGEIDVIKRDIP